MDKVPLKDIKKVEDIVESSKDKEIAKEVKKE